MKKINNPSTEVTEGTKIYFDEYIDTIAFRKKPVSENWILQLAKRMRDWAVNDKHEALALNDFYNQEGICASDIKRWEARVPALRIAHEVALRTIGARRDKGAVKREYDGNQVRYSLPKYDVDAKHIEEWRSSLRADQSVKEEFEAAVARYVAARDVILKELPVSEDVPSKRTPEEVAGEYVKKMKDGRI